MWICAVLLGFQGRLGQRDRLVRSSVLRFVSPSYRYTLLPERSTSVLFECFVFFYSKLFTMNPKKIFRTFRRETRKFSHLACKVSGSPQIVRIFIFSHLQPAFPGFPGGCRLEKVRMSLLFHPLPSFSNVCTLREARSRFIHRQLKSIH